MASALDVVTEWATYGSEQADLFGNAPLLVYRWVNQGQLRFASKGEVLRSVWNPTLTSTGTIALPADFLREFRDKVQWSSTQFLVKIDYPLGKILNMSTVLNYSIWGGAFYVFAPTAGSPFIWYVKKPAVITTAGFSAAELEIDTVYHERLIEYLQARFQRHKGNEVNYQALLKQFDMDAVDAGIEFGRRQDALPSMRGNWF